jgi:hypothetical protein
VLIFSYRKRALKSTNPNIDWSRTLESEHGIPVLHFYDKTDSRYVCVCIFVYVYVYMCVRIRICTYRYQLKAGHQSDVWDCTHYCEPHSPEVALMTELLVDKLAMLDADKQHPYSHKASAKGL